MSTRKLFGTDGIRGKANVFPMTSEVATALGRAVTHFFQSEKKQKSPLIIIGKDTRLSCYMLEQAFASGVCSQGGRAILTGPLPTPAVAFVIESMRADAGVIISASHNPFYDNGIKIFDGNGDKLEDDIEKKLEAMVLRPEMIPVKVDSELGRAKRLDEVIGRYVVHAKSCFDKDMSLEGLRIVLDCSNGAGYKVAPMIFNELGADVIEIGTSPNGQNINLGCGSLYPDVCAKKVVEYRADLGVALDGDADRVVIIDKKGNAVDGDHLIGILAKYLKEHGELDKKAQVVGTVMSNIGLEIFLKENGMKFTRTKVGDRYILENMRKTGAKFGGEPSGHVIFGEHAKTGDGIITALKVLECLIHYKKDISELVSEFDLFPQQMVNVGVKEKPDLSENEKIQKAIKKYEKEMNGKGRILLRYSGTEPLLRIMVEGDNSQLVEKAVNGLKEICEKELK